MLYWNNYKNHTSDIIGKRKKFDNTIYSFDIETSSYFMLDGKQYNTNDYLKIDEKSKKRCIYGSFMYIWQFSINDVVYYGRTWEEFEMFLKRLEENVPELKIIYVHNLSFEFQFLKSHFHFEDVVARKSHKVMSAFMRDFNIIFKCSYFLSNCALEYLPKVFNLPVEKKVGDLDYNLIRTPTTPLTNKELKYCEYDCLVVYHYIKEERNTYGDLKHIPTTSTGKVRRELMEITRSDYKYKRVVKRAININPHVYNLLQEAFMGGYTHANWIYADEILKNVDSYDETSAYPYVLTTYKYPASEFRKVNIKRREEMSSNFCYLLVVKFKNIKCKYYNTFISLSKCRNIRGGKYDNGRIIEAREFEITLTDIDFYFILDSYKCEYEILECYSAFKRFLPKKFINFVLEKYVIKTKYKDVENMEIEYQKEKNKFNSLYGMSVTNNIRDNVIYDDITELWSEVELSNEEIEEKLLYEKKKSFLSFAYGVWVTAYARDNLLRRVLELDEYVCYCDTDSCKVIPGYDKNVFIKYNKSVEDRINYVSKILNIDKTRYAPYDIHGKSHMLGIFESETKESHKFTYDEFITQGAKKYATKLDGKIKITVSGVPKKASVSLKDLNDFRDNYVFKYEDTNKKMLMYLDFQEEREITDYLGNKEKVLDRSGCCILPTTYVLNKALDYANLLTDNSSKRSIYKE